MSRSGKALLCALILLSFSLFSAAHAAPDRRVLILNSYHQGFKWTDEETQGAIAGLSAMKNDLKFYVEYMGTKWVYDKHYLEQLHETYKLKFRNVHFDIIIATDNDAFDFLLRYRDDVFGKVPVVFCGVNWFRSEDISGQSLYTGVNEDADIATNFDLMLQLHPQTKHIYVVADLTTTGRIVHEKIREILPKYRNKVAIHLLDDMEMAAILDTVAHLSDDSLVFITLFQQDKAGAFFEYSETAGLISKSSRVPVYGLWDFYLGSGIVGGMLTSGYEQGHSAGTIALRILQGESPDALPVIMKSPNKYMFDYQQMVRFGMKPSELPEGSIVINEPPSFYAVNKGLVWGLLSGLVCLFVIVVVLLVNIHRRNRAERALQASEVKYQTLVDNLNVGIYRNSGYPDGRFLQANPAMVKIFGYDSLDEFMQVPVSGLYQNPEDRKAFIDHLMLTGALKDKTLPMKKKDGTPIWVSCSANVSYDERGGIKWIDGVNEDITEQKQLEEQLRQAQKMEAIGTLAGGVAHDFNNILTAIIGYGNLLKMKISKDDPLTAYIAPILASAERAAQLTQSLLAFSRKQIIRLKAVDLNDIVSGMEQLLLRVIGEDIELTTSRRAGSLMVMADMGQIEQVLLNLVTNARDAMPDGGILCIGTDLIVLEKEFLIKHEFMKPGNYAVLSVSDTGYGMDETIQQRIFEPFFSTKEVGKGTGLGLSIVYGIVKQHNGDISVYSERGKGSTFKVYLPLVNVATETSEQEAAVPAEGGSETILIGEDNEEVRKLAKEILVIGGYSVVHAGDGEDAIALFKDNIDAIDLLLLDVVMPKKNGSEVYEELRKLKPTLKVLFMSGYTADIIHQKGILDQGINFISKPLSPEKLLRKVKEVLSQ